MGFLLNNIEDVAAKAFGTTVDCLEHDVYKYTKCGAWIVWDDSSVTIGSIVEGSDAEFEKKFEYPIDSDEIDNWINDLEELCDEAWKEANLNELMVTLEGGEYLYFRTEGETLNEAKLEFYGALINSHINYDNVKFTSFVLRDPYGNDIEE